MASAAGIGAQEDKKVEVRVVCATNRNLEAEIEAGTFRQDLYYRINVVNIRSRRCGNDAATLKTWPLIFSNTTTASSTARRVRCE